MRKNRHIIIKQQAKSVIFLVFCLLSALFVHPQSFKARNLECIDCYNNEWAQRAHSLLR